MAKVKGDGGGYKPAVIGPQVGIDGATYGERAKAFVASKGGTGAILYGPDNPNHDPARWASWLAYFDRLDGMSQPRGKKAYTYSRPKVLTVPAEWPDDFDASCPTSDRRPRPKLIRAQAFDSDRKATTDAVRRRVDAAAAESAFPRDPRHPDFRQPPPKPKTPEQLAAEYREKPVTLSPAALATLGLGYREAAE